MSDLLLLLEPRQGTQAALDLYQRVKAHAVPGYQVDEPSLNALGYQLLGKKKVDDAIKVFAQNVQEYPQGPQGFNCYDSLGEGYVNAGQKELAIKNYEKSLELNPQNTNAVEMLKKIRAEK